MRLSYFYIRLLLVGIFAAACSSPWYKQEPPKQLDRLWDAAFRDIDIAESDDRQITAKWQLSQCPLTYELYERAYVYYYEPSSTSGSGAEKQIIKEHRAFIDIDDDLKKGTREAAVSQSQNRTTHNSDEGRWYEGSKDDDYSDISAQLTTDGRSWISKEKAPTIWNSLVHMVVHFPALKPSMKVGDSYAWEIYKPVDEVAKKAQQRGNDNYSISFMPNEVTLVVEKIISIQNTRAVLLSATVPIGDTQYQDVLVAGRPVGIRYRDYGGLSVRYLVSSEGQLLWSGVSITVHSEEQDLAIQQPPRKTQQAHLAELRLVESCKAPSLSRFEAVKYHNDTKAMRFLSRFAKDASEKSTEALRGYFEHSGLSPKQRESYVKALGEFIEQYGHEPLGSTSKLKSYFDPDSRHETYYEVRGNTGFHYRTQSEVYYDKYFEVDESVITDYEYRCTDKSHSQCGYQSITVKSHDEKRIYLELTPSKIYVRNPHSCIVYANSKNKNSQEKSNGLSWKTAYADLQSAIDLAGTKATKHKPCFVWAAQGVYRPSINENGEKTPKDARERSFVLIDKVGILGGFRGDETHAIHRPKGAMSILEGDIGVPGDMSDNSYNVVTAKEVVVALGQIIIQNGNANQKTRSELLKQYREDADVDGMFNSKSQQWQDKIEKQRRGGGLFAAYAIVYLHNVRILNNYASSGGGGGYFKECNAEFRNAEVANNRSIKRAAGLYFNSTHLSTCKILFEASIVKGNHLADPSDSKNADDQMTARECYTYADKDSIVPDWIDPL